MAAIGEANRLATIAVCYYFIPQEINNYIVNIL